MFTFKNLNLSLTQFEHELHSEDHGDRSKQMFVEGDLTSNKLEFVIYKDDKVESKFDANDEKNRAKALDAYNCITL
jgi:hypothetical protein